MRNCGLSHLYSVSRHVRSWATDILIYKALLTIQTTQQSHRYLYLSKIGELCLFVTKSSFAFYWFKVIETQLNKFLILPLNARFLYGVSGQVKSLKQIGIFFAFCYIFFILLFASKLSFPIQIASQVHVYSHLQ